MKAEFPILKKWYDINLWIMDTAGKFPKNVRFTFSDRIINISMDILEDITAAVYSKNRNILLEKISISVEKIRLLIRMSNDKGYIAVSQYEYISREINEAGKMLGGWMKKDRGTNEKI